MGESENRSFGPSAFAWIITAALIAFLALITIPIVFRVHDPRQANFCINNRRQIDGAKQQWAIENGKTNDDTEVSEKDIEPYLGRDPNGSFPQCPSGGKYVIGKLNQPARCSLGASVNPPHILPTAGIPAD